MPTLKLPNILVENYMRPVKASNDERTFYLVGALKDQPHTLCVVPNPEAFVDFRLYCEIHQLIYPVTDVCPSCGP